MENERKREERNGGERDKKPEKEGAGSGLARVAGCGSPAEIATTTTATSAQPHARGTKTMKERDLAEGVTAGERMNEGCVSLLTKKKNLPFEGYSWDGGNPFLKAYNTKSKSP